MAEKMGINDFINDTKPGGSGAEHFNLKEKGKGIIWLHPGSGIYKRNTHWIPNYGEVTENNKKVKRTFQTMVICPGTDTCPICLLRKALRGNDDIDNDEIIMRVGEGKEEVEVNKGEIIGAEGYGWQRSFAYKTEYAFGIVDNDNAENVQVLIAPKSLGKKITKVIEDQIEEEGEEKGNPFKNPYAFKLTHDKNAENPNEVYNAVWNKAELTDEIQELLEGSGPDLSPLVKSTPISRIAWLIKQGIAVDPDDLEIDLSAADDYNPQENQRSDSDDKSSKPSKPVKPAKQEKETSAKPSKTTKATKSAKQSKPKVEMEPCPECGESIEKTATECKHCGAEFEIEETIECPECGKDIPADSETCPKCGEDVLPF